MTTDKVRLTAAARSEEVLRAAVTAFAASGYAGTKTDEIARLAGVSQPYVIRLFGTKQQLFIAAVERAHDRIAEAFRLAAADRPDLVSLGEGAQALLAERELLVMLLHGFAASGEPEIGAVVRERFRGMQELVRELTGASAEELRDFLGAGMLLAVLAAMRVLGPDAIPVPWAAELFPPPPAAGSSE